LVGNDLDRHRMIEVHPACFMQVRVPADMQRAKREGKMGIIFFFESAEMLEGKIERIELFRTMPLVHASRNTSRCLLQDSSSGWICAGGDQ